VYFNEYFFPRPSTGTKLVCTVQKSIHGELRPSRNPALEPGLVYNIYYNTYYYIYGLEHLRQQKWPYLDPTARWYLFEKQHLATSMTSLRMLWIRLAATWTFAAQVVAAEDMTAWRKGRDCTNKCYTERTYNVCDIL